MNFMFTDGHDTDTVDFEKVKVEDSVGLKYKFYNAILKVSSFWRGFSWSTKSDSRYISEENNRTSTPFHPQFLVVMWLLKILISQILIYSDVQMSRYFSKSCGPVLMMLLAPGVECHLDFYPKSFTYPNFVTIVMMIRHNYLCVCQSHVVFP